MVGFGRGRRKLSLPVHTQLFSSETHLDSLEDHWPLCQSSIAGGVYSCPTRTTGVWSEAIDGEVRQVHSTEFILSTTSGAPQTPWYQLSWTPRTWPRQDNRRLAVQCYRCSSQEPSYCTQVLSVGKDCKPAFAFGSSQLLWYSEPYKKISSRRESCVCAPALYLCACRGTVMVTRASRSTPFLRNLPRKKGLCKVRVFKTQEQNKNIFEASDLCRWGKAGTKEFTCGNAVEEYCPHSSQHRRQPHLLAHSRSYKWAWFQSSAWRIIQTLLLRAVRKHGASCNGWMPSLYYSWWHCHTGGFKEEHQTL